jgi:hypothetical protein
VHAYLSNFGALICEVVDLSMYVDVSFASVCFVFFPLLSSRAAQVVLSGDISRRAV